MPLAAKSIPAAPMTAASPRETRVIALPVPRKRPAVGWWSQRLRALAAAVVPPVITLIILLAIWQLVFDRPGASLPSPLQVWADAQDLILQPFYVAGSQDMGLGWRVLVSLQRVAYGFGLAAVVGVLVGAIAGMSRGSVDAALMWLADLFLALPQLPLLLLIIYLFREQLSKLIGSEGGIFVMVVAVIGGLRWMQVARLVRAQILSIREKEFVEAARALGASNVRQVVRHILPNALGPVIVAGTIDVAAAIIAESTLSFLGLGFPPDVPTWGRVLFDAKDTMDIAPHWVLFSGGAIFLAVLTINFIGDGLRDALDPRRVL